MANAFEKWIKLPHPAKKMLFFSVTNARRETQGERERQTENEKDGQRKRKV